MVGQMYGGLYRDRTIFFEVRNVLCHIVFLLTGRERFGISMKLR